MNTKKNTEEISARRHKALAVVLGGSASITILLQGLFSPVIPAAPTKSSQMANAISATQAVVSPFDNLSLEAHAVYVFEIKTGTILFSKNENEKLPLASITKLMTAFVAREQVSESTIITLTKDNLSAEGDSGLNVGERWRAGDLLSLMLLVSSNDAAHAVAEFIGRETLSEGQRNIQLGSSHAREQFVAMMNEKASALGLTKMEFFNESGLDINENQNNTPVRAGGYGSARDVATLFLELWRKYPDIVEATSYKDARIVSQDGITHFLLNTNGVVGRVPGMIASKTGFTDLAGGNLVVIFDRGIGDPVAVVVLGSSYKGRFNDVEKLASAVLQKRVAVADLVK